MMAILSGTSKEIWEWLRQAGIAMEGQDVRRVVIDMAVAPPVMVFVEIYGSDKLISVAPPDMSTAQVVVLGKT